jgi:hypothetical protein
MPDPRLLPLLDLIAANIAATVIAERASVDSSTQDADSEAPGKPTEQTDAHEVRSGVRVTEAAP